MKPLRIEKAEDKRYTVSGGQKRDFLLVWNLEELKSPKKFWEVTFKKR